MNMRDYQAKHLDTNYIEGTTLLLLCYFGSLCRVFNNDHISCPKVRETALVVERYSMIFAIYNCIAQMRDNQHENKTRGEVI
jgi:hypothetical protein